MMTTMKMMMTTMRMMMTTMRMMMTKQFTIPDHHTDDDLNWDSDQDCGNYKNSMICLVILILMIEKLYFYDVES